MLKTSNELESTRLKQFDREKKIKMKSSINQFRQAGLIYLAVENNLRRKIKSAGHPKSGAQSQTGMNSETTSIHHASI